MANSILRDLDAVLKRQKEIKVAQVKKLASPGDGAPDGTKAPETGAQMTANKSNAAVYSEAAVDAGAKTNPEGASVSNSTEGAVAAATSGQSGSKGGDLGGSDPKKAPNGPDDAKSDAEKGRDGMKAASAGKLLADELRKAAAALKAPATATVSKTAAAVPATKGSEVTGDKSNLSALDCFLVKAARTNPHFKVAAAGMDDQQAAGDVGAQLMQAIESGQLGEEDAEKILMEMMQSGAISKEDVAQAMQEMHAGQGAGPTGPDALAGAAGGAGAGPDAGAAAGAGADPMAGAAGPGADAGAAGAAVPGPDAGADPMAQAKMAAAHVDRQHPQYIEKLATFHEADMVAGYNAGIKLAEALAKMADESDDGDHGKDPSASAVPAAPADPMAGGDDSATLNPSDPECQKALLKLLADMGITPEDLQQLMAQKHQAPAGMDPKTAAYREKATVAILRKVAQLTLTAQNQGK